MPNEGLTGVFKTTLRAPNVEAARKDPANWPAELIAELGNDDGLSAANRCGERFGNDFRAIRKILDDFNPDLVVVWGDDQYENFREDIVPAFCLLGYDDQFEIKPWDNRQWRQAEPLGRAGRLAIEAEGPSRGGQIPRHRPDRAGHRHGLRVQAAAPPDGPCLYQYVSLSRLGPGGLSLSGDPVRDQLLRPHPAPRQRRPRPSVPATATGRRSRRPAVTAPWRCMQVGAAVAQVLAASPYRAALIASSSWSHAFLSPKNGYLWPDHEGDRLLFDAVSRADYDIWRKRSLAEMEFAGQHEMLNWMALIGAMEALDRRPVIQDYMETYILASDKCFLSFPP